MSIYEMNKPLFVTYAEATNVLDRMREIARMYGNVTLADIMDLADMRSEYYFNKHYWLKPDLKNAKVVWDENLQRYYIKLPASTMEINKSRENDKSSDPVYITIHVNDLDDPNAVLAETFKYIYTIKDRTVNLTIM